MRRNQKLRHLKSAAFTSLAAILLCEVFASATPVLAQRLGRPPIRREVEGTPILPSGTGVIPEGTPLILEIDDRLDSGEARVGDRFAALVAVPIIDSGGKTVLQPGTRIEGKVTSVRKAKWRHRSGAMSLSFDYLLLGERRIPIRGALISSNQRLDEEGNVKANSSTRRDILVTSGGAGAGVGIGAATGGGMLVGGGIGAAAGLTVALLMKGKDVIIRPGDRFNLELVQPLVISSARPTTTIKFPTPVGPGQQPRPRPTLITPSQSIPTNAGRVAVNYIQADRGGDGYLRVLVTAETPSSGWRIYTNHELRGNDALDVRLYGVQESRSAVRQLSRPQAPMIIVHDPGNAIRSVVAHGLNGARTLSVGASPGLVQTQPQTGSRPNQTGQQPVRPRPSEGPSDGSSFDIPTYPSTGPSTGNATAPATGTTTAPPTQLSALATQVAREIDTVRFTYSGFVGLYLNEGRVEDLEKYGGRRPTANERELFNTLTFMHNSARTLSTPAVNAFDKQRAAQQLQADTQKAQQLWPRVRSTGIISQDLDRRWQNLQGNLRGLIETALR